MPAVLDWLTGSLATAGAESISVATTLGALAFVVGLFAAARGARWVWPAGAVAALLFGVESLIGDRFVDAGIRLVLALLCTYGWRVRRSDPAGSPRHAEGREIAYGVVLFAIATVVAAFALTGQSDDAAAWGAAVVVAAAFVQVAALARRLVIGWWAVIASGLVSLVLAAVSAYWATVVVSVAITLAGVYGWRCWRREAAASVPLSFPVDENAMDEEDLVA